MVASTILLGIIGFQNPAVISKMEVKVKELTTIEGKKVQIAGKDIKATALIFTAVDCPIANRMAPEIARIQSAYKAKNVQVVLVYPEKTLTPKQVSKHLKEYGLSGPAVIDKTQEIRHMVGVTVTPQVAVVGKDHKIKYLGRINDLFEAHGNAKAKVTKNDLRNALDEIVAGKPISVPYTQPVGCILSD